jgi:hypothetical protein
MIFLGDIACPNEKNALELDFIFKQNLDIFSNKNTICNLEGMISDEVSLDKNIPILFNHPKAIEVLKNNHLKVAGLANNHLLDLPEYFDNTTTILKEKEILFLGASRNKDYVSTPIFFDDNGKNIILFNYCWDFLLCLQKNPTNGIFISIISEKIILETIKQYRTDYPESYIALFFHWNLDLETLPFPMHRQFSKDLIDVGANLIVGAHSHCVQGGEKYKDGYIIYGLGNFFIPNSTFVMGNLKFPDFAKIELAFEFDFIENRAKCHWFEYSNEDGLNRLKIIESSYFEDSKLLKVYSPYDLMGNSEYLAYFKKNRRKKTLIPIIKNYKNTRINKIKIYLLKLRVFMARFMAKRRLIKWQS